VGRQLGTFKAEQVRAIYFADTPSAAKPENPASEALETLKSVLGTGVTYRGYVLNAARPLAESVAGRQPSFTSLLEDSMNRLGIALAPFVILGALAAAVGAQEKAKPALAKASVSPPFEKRGNLNMSPQHAVRDTRSPTQ